MNDRLTRRPKGALCYPLSTFELAGIIQAELDRQGNTPNGTIHPDHYALVYGPGRSWGLVMTEGVGVTAEDYDQEVSVWYSIGEYGPVCEVKLPFNIIQGALDGTNMDLADFIRVFGDRLDSNHYTWYDFTEKEVAPAQ